MFFTRVTDNTELVIPSKHENIYNQDEINKNSRKDLIVSIMLSRKVIMMIVEEGTCNFMNFKY